MYFEESLRIELMAIEGLENKVYPLTASEGTNPPYVVYTSSEGVFEKTLDGGYITGTKEIECEIHILTGSYSNLKTLSREVITKITSFQGRVIGGLDGVRIVDVEYDNPHEEYIEDLQEYLCVLTLTVKL